MNQEMEDLMAYLIHCRFGKDVTTTIAAWKRLIQNDGWDNKEGIFEFKEMLERGRRYAREIGISSTLW